MQVSLDGTASDVEQWMTTLSDELWMWVHPTVVGRGDRLFAEDGTKKAMQLNHSKVYENEVVGLRYQSRTGLSRPA